MSDIFAHFNDIPGEDDSSPESASDKRKRFATAAAALAYIRGGRATITLVSGKTGARFTYRIGANEDRSCLFVGVLTGSDNESSYSYAGRIARDIFWQGRKTPRAGDVSAAAPSSKAFAWAWRALVRGTLPDVLEIWHEGRCGRCGRKLTVPASIESGFGPECINKM